MSWAVVIRRFMAVVSILCGVGAVFADLEITSFNSNGKLTWDDSAGTGTDYAVQWEVEPNRGGMARLERC